MRALRILNSQGGQSIVEYILVLVVTVGLVLGGIYQLNMAFKVWANNYFGDYLACLLETGELPSAGGTVGGGPCDQFFKPFSLADGRPLLPPGQGQQQESGKHDYSPGAGSRDKLSGGGRNGGGGSGGSFGGPAYNGKNGGGKLGANGSKSSASNTGSTKTVSYGSYNDGRNRSETRTKEQLDQKFAFENDQGDKLHGKSAATSRNPADSGSGLNKARQRQHEKEKNGGGQDDSPMTFGNFMKYLIIAAIVIALVFFIGGQMLQIGKSME